MVMESRRGEGTDEGLVDVRVVEGVCIGWMGGGLNVREWGGHAARGAIDEWRMERGRWTDWKGSS